MKRVALLLAVTLIAGCSRENRDYQPKPVARDAEPQIVMSSNRPGGSTAAVEMSPIGQQYEASAYHISQGKKLFSWFNCNGCHSNGGGGSGPALMDDSWIYGSSIDNIAQTIREGRPNGMPSFRGKITDEQIWQIAAYVRALGGLVSPDAMPGRNDDLNPHPPEGQLTHKPPVNGAAPSPAEQMPQ